MSGAGRSNHEVEREYTRIGLGPNDRLPQPKGIKSDSEYLAFLRRVPDKSGVQGFIATMAKGGTQK